jgi:hypothetical protein
LKIGGPTGTTIAVRPSDNEIIIIRGNNILLTNIKITHKYKVMKYIREQTYCNVVLRDISSCYSKYKWKIISIEPSTMTKVGKVIKLTKSHIKNYVTIKFSDGTRILSRDMLQPGLTYEYKYDYNDDDDKIILSFKEINDYSHESNKLVI